MTGSAKWFANWFEWFGLSRTSVFSRVRTSSSGSEPWFRAGSVVRPPLRGTTRTRTSGGLHIASPQPGIFPLKSPKINAPRQRAGFVRHPKHERPCLIICWPLPPKRGTPKRATDKLENADCRAYVTRSRSFTAQSYVATWESARSRLGAFKSISIFQVRYRAQTHIVIGDSRLGNTCGVPVRFGGFSSANRQSIGLIRSDYRGFARVRAAKCAESRPPNFAAPSRNYPAGCTQPIAEVMSAMVCSRRAVREPAGHLRRSPSRRPRCRPRPRLRAWAAMRFLRGLAMNRSIPDSEEKPRRGSR